VEELGVYVDYGLVLILPDYEFGLCMVRISGKLFATYMVWIESLRAFLNDLDDLVFAAD